MGDEYDVYGFVARQVVAARRAQLESETWKVLNDMGNSRNEWALIGPVQCVWSTERSVKVLLKGDILGVWIPKSQLHPTENEITKTGDEGMLVIPVWLAKEKEWL